MKCFNLMVEKEVMSVFKILFEMFLIIYLESERRKTELLLTLLQVIFLIFFMPRVGYWVQGGKKSSSCKIKTLK